MPSTSGRDSRVLRDRRTRASRPAATPTASAGHEEILFQLRALDGDAGFASRRLDRERSAGLGGLLLDARARRGLGVVVFGRFSAGRLGACCLGAGRLDDGLRGLVLRIGLCLVVGGLRLFVRGLGFDVLGAVGLVDGDEHLVVAGVGDLERGGQLDAHLAIGLDVASDEGLVDRDLFRRLSGGVSLERVVLFSFGGGLRLFDGGVLGGGAGGAVLVGRGASPPLRAPAAAWRWPERYALKSSGRIRSSTWRNAARSSPTSMNAACIPGRTRLTLPR